MPRGDGAFVTAPRFGLGNFFARLFGGGGEEEDSEVAAPPPPQRKQWGLVARKGRGAPAEAASAPGRTLASALSTPSRAVCAATGARVRTVATFPANTHPPIVYPAALVKDANPTASAFLAYLKGPQARAIFERVGFTVLARP